MEKNIKDVIEQLRNFATVPGKQKTWISELTDQQIYQIYIMLRNGNTGQYIAKHIQDIWKIHTSTSIHSSGQGISKFKKRIAHLLIIPKEEQSSNPISPSNRRDNRYHSSESLEELAYELEDRIRKIMAEEKRTGIYGLINKEVNSLSSLRKTILKEKKYEIEHAKDDPTILRRQQLNGKHRQKQLEALISRLPDQGSRVVEMGEQFFKLLEERSIITKYDAETDTYIAKDEDLLPHGYK